MEVILTLEPQDVTVISRALNQCLHPARCFILESEWPIVTRVREKILAQAEGQMPLPSNLPNGKRP